MLIKILPLIFASVFMLSACSVEVSSAKASNLEGVSQEAPVVEKNTYLSLDLPIALKEVHFGDDKFKFNRGIYSVCLNGDAYVVNAQSSTMFIPVMDNFEQVKCVDKYAKMNVRILHTDTNRGVYEFCMGGYDFIVVSEASSSSFIQQRMLKNGKAKICIPPNTNKDFLDKLAFIHPEVESKISKVHELLNDDTINDGPQKKKIY